MCCSDDGGGQIHGTARVIRNIYGAGGLRGYDKRFAAEVIQEFSDQHPELFRKEEDSKEE